MSSAIPLPTSPAEDDLYFRAVLLDLVDRGARLARAVQEGATAAAVPPDGGRAAPDASIAFDRIARGVRRCIALARHIAATPAIPTAAGRPDAVPGVAARAAVIRGVEDAVHRRARHAPEGVDVQDLQNQLTEILEDPSLEFDLRSRPVSDIVDEICRDFGVYSASRSFVFKPRTPADRARLRARAAAPLLSPFPEGGGPPHPPAELPTPPPSG